MPCAVWINHNGLIVAANYYYFEHETEVVILLTKLLVHIDKYFLGSSYVRLIQESHMGLAFLG